MEPDKMGDRKAIEWMVALTREDLLLIIGALNEILNDRAALRAGVERSHIVDLLKRIGERLDEIEKKQKRRDA
jgi:hypothetical protein